MSIGHHGLLFNRVGGDPSWTSVSALLHFDGGNGSTSFIDSGPIGHAVSRGSPATQVSDFVKFGPSSFDPAGTSGFARMAPHDSFNFGSGNFTVEAWIYATAAASGTQAICCKWRNTSSGLSWYMGRDSSGRLFFYYSQNGSSGTFPASTGTIPVSQWVHAAVVRDSSTLRFFINGSASGTASITGTLAATTSVVSVGNDGDNTPIGQRFVGRIDELRITKGVARYTATFTPPTSPFPDF